MASSFIWTSHCCFIISLYCGFLWKTKHTSPMWRIFHCRVPRCYVTGAVAQNSLCRKVSNVSFSLLWLFFGFYSIFFWDHFIVWCACLTMRKHCWAPHLELLTLSSSLWVPHPELLTASLSHVFWALQRHSHTGRWRHLLVFQNKVICRVASHFMKTPRCFAPKSTFITTIYIK